MFGVCGFLGLDPCSDSGEEQMLLSLRDLALAHLLHKATSMDGTQGPQPRTEMGWKSRRS
jgi:hypothetical protein